MTLRDNGLPFRQTLRDCIAYYVSQGYREVKVFPKKYIFMYNVETGEKVRLYLLSNRVYEY